MNDGRASGFFYHDLECTGLFFAFFEPQRRWDLFFTQAHKKDSLFNCCRFLSDFGRS